MTYTSFEILLIARCESSISRPLSPSGVADVNLCKLQEMKEREMSGQTTTAGESLVSSQGIFFQSAPTAGDRQSISPTMHMELLEMVSLSLR